MYEYNLTPKREFAIKLVCFLIVIGLCLAVYVNGKDLSCDNCSINFKAYKRVGDSNSNKVHQEFKVSLQDIHKSFLEEHCLVEFDLDNGYILRDKNNTSILKNVI